MSVLCVESSSRFRNDKTQPNKLSYLFQDELVLLLQQFVVRVDEVQVVLGCGVVDSPQLLQECLAEHADSLMYIHHVVDDIFAVFVGNLVVLEK